MAMAALVAMAKVADPYIREGVAICGRTLRIIPQEALPSLSSPTMRTRSQVKRDIPTNPLLCLANLAVKERRLPAPKVGTLSDNLCML